MAPPFLTSALGGDEWSASRSYRFTLGETDPHKTIARQSGWASKAGLDGMEKRGVSWVCSESNPDSSASRLIAWSLYQLSFPGS
jgi:hypothetical protein